MCLRIMTGFIWLKILPLKDFQKRVPVVVIILLLLLNGSLPEQYKAVLTYRNGSLICYQCIVIFASFDAVTLLGVTGPFRMASGHWQLNWLLYNHQWIWKSLFRHTNCIEDVSLSYNTVYTRIWYWAHDIINYKLLV